MAHSNRAQRRARAHFLMKQQRKANTNVPNNDDNHPNNTDYHPLEPPLDVALPRKERQKAAKAIEREERQRFHTSSMALSTNPNQCQKSSSLSCRCYIVSRRSLQKTSDLLHCAHQFISLVSSSSSSLYKAIDNRLRSFFASRLTHRL